MKTKHNTQMGQGIIGNLQPGEPFIYNHGLFMRVANYEIRGISGPVDINAVNLGSGTLHAIAPDLIVGLVDATVNYQ